MGLVSKVVRTFPLLFAVEVSLISPFFPSFSLPPKWSSFFTDSLVVSLSIRRSASVPLPTLSDRRK